MLYVATTQLHGFSSLLACVPLYSICALIMTTLPCTIYVQHMHTHSIYKTKIMGRSQSEEMCKWILAEKTFRSNPDQNEPRDHEPGQRPTTTNNVEPNPEPTITRQVINCTTVTFTISISLILLSLLLSILYHNIIHDLSPILAIPAIMSQPALFKAIQLSTL